MCMACEEMQLFYAYLDSVEEAKLKAQPWECQVTVFPQDDDQPAQASEAAPVAKAKSKVKSKARARSQAKPQAKDQAKSGFACDEA